jgi:hypothetical protein
MENERREGQREESRRPAHRGAVAAETECLSMRRLREQIGHQEGYLG